MSDDAEQGLEELWEQHMQSSRMARSLALSMAWANCAKDYVIARLVSNHILQSMLKVR